ncbi:MAG TPA: hypothetical protein PL101_00915 [Bacteroidales bacterium]|nr:hypothetical protein [Bacteroidales bacterium]HQK69651.1 hypothetical protein [Bacteroidales bacterium]
MKRIVLTAIMILAFSSSMLLAQRGTVSNSARQGVQQERINEGIRSGELTRREARLLKREQRKIQIEKKLAQADGQVTPREKRFLRREQNRASRHIARQKHDRQSR